MCDKLVVKLHAKIAAQTKQKKNKKKKKTKKNQNYKKRKMIKHTIKLTF